ncbi:MAG: MarR family transcriptional regulator [Deltaproteobacteria bacterium]|jgi:DNA-binding MarR family transcriptional regulator|nr:MarR family transcriptional regulator [Deltaproteobacteria bacterium]
MSYMKTLPAQKPRSNVKPASRIKETLRAEIVPSANEITDLELFELFNLLKILFQRAHVNHEQAQTQLLDVIYRRQSIDQQELLLMFPLRTAYMIQLLTKLEKLGLISRPRRPSDRRRVNVEITEAGKCEVESRKSHITNNLERFFSCLTGNERRALSGILNKLSVSFQEMLGSKGERHTSNRSSH